MSDTPTRVHFRFNLQEFAGSIGDYGTLIPIVLGVVVVSNIDLGQILFFFGICYILVGLYYKIPLPVQPMKAVGALVIAQGLSREEIAASGIILGVFFLVLGFLGGMKFIEKYVPKSVVRGIQLGLVVLLFKTSFRFVNEDYVLAIICLSLMTAFFCGKEVF